MAIEKCTFEGCARTGEPQEGFDFYACAECLTELERLITEKRREMNVATVEQNGVVGELVVDGDKMRIHFSEKA